MHMERRRHGLASTCLSIAAINANSKLVTCSFFVISPNNQRFRSLYLGASHPAGDDLEQRIAWKTTHTSTRQFNPAVIKKNDDV